MNFLRNTIEMLEDIIKDEIVIFLVAKTNLYFSS